MKKNFLIIIFLSLTIIANSNNISDTLYKKGAYQLGLSCFPQIDAYSLNLGSWGLTISPSISYFIFNNFSVSGSLYYQQLWAFQAYDNVTNVNLLNTSIFLRYYFFKSHFFIEGSYNYGLTKLNGFMNHKEVINNPGIGFGITGLFNDIVPKFNGKLSWEYSIKYRIPTSYAPVDSYSSISRFAIVYHF